KYEDAKIVLYLNKIKEDVLDNLQAFKGAKEDPHAREGFAIDYFHDYEVNIILDNSNMKTAPVVVEISPTNTNLFGTIEKVSDGNGNWFADFTKIKAGSLLKANGGYIVLRAVHLFEEPGAWKILKRILNYRKLEIQDSHVSMAFSQSMLKPEPIEINAKVILLGNNYLYYMLSGYEDDFKKIFKIKADFDSEIKRTPTVIMEYARVIKKMIDEEGMKEFDKTAVAHLIEMAARYAGDKQKLTTRFSYLADIAREADYWAGTLNDNVVTSKHIELAYKKSRSRHSLSEEKLSENILDNIIMIETGGERIGCINGLAVYGTDYYSFGKPVRITASIALGSGSIINVEREAGLSGKIHDKGILIITGFFRETFGKFFPLTFTSNIVFEQSYGQIDGDSASAAEIFVLLSALSDLPMTQSLAVTGSVNQKGEIQPIGGVNEKIEGFFDLCNSRKLTKQQGVIIPKQNINDLMLRSDIQEAVRKNEFHIYPIENIGEGIEILTGKKAGNKRVNQKYEKGTIFSRVETHLKIMYELAKNPLRDKHPEKHKTGVKGKAVAAKTKAKPNTARKAPAKSTARQTTKAKITKKAK
ncbi:MAG: Lon protease family protein, partial [Ignavibacteriales bacterium]|nr:Lon protease family protein [Ignavibacteriales bacterium]